MTMGISSGLKSLQFIYESRLWLLIPLCILWAAYAIRLGRQRNKLLRLWLLVLPMVILPLLLPLCLLMVFAKRPSKRQELDTQADHSAEQPAS